MTNFFRNYKDRFLFAIMFNILLIAMQVFQKGIESFLSGQPLSFGFISSYLSSLVILIAIIFLLKGNKLLNGNKKKI